MMLNYGLYKLSIPTYIKAKMTSPEKKLHSPQATLKDEMKLVHRASISVCWLLKLEHQALSRVVKIQSWKTDCFLKLS